MDGSVLLRIHFLSIEEWSEGIEPSWPSTQFTFLLSYHNYGGSCPPPPMTPPLVMTNFIESYIITPP